MKAVPGDAQPWLRFVDELPDCCRAGRLRLPRPSLVRLDARGCFDDETWECGLSEWAVRVGVSWDDDAAEALLQVVGGHVGGEFRELDGVHAVLGVHGVHLDDVEYGNAWVGEQDVVVAHIDDALAAAAGRKFVSTGWDLWEAADAAADDLQSLIAPLITDGDDGDLWGPTVLDMWPDALMTRAVILLRSVNVTPVMRGYHLGAWTAAQSIALFDQADSMVVTKAAPLSRRDAVPNSDEARDMTDEESALWKSEQDRLVRHWQTQLGLQPVPSEPTVLTWHTSHRNANVENVLRLWA